LKFLQVVPQKKIKLLLCIYRRKESYNCTPGLNDTNMNDEKYMDLIVEKFKTDNSIDGIILVYSSRGFRKAQKHKE